MRPRTFICATLVAAALLAPSAALAERPHVLLDVPSAINGRVIVTDEGDLRVMRFAPGGARQTVIRPGHPEQLELEYTRGVLAALAIVPAPRRALVIGLGGGAIPSFLRLRYPELDIDVVDIDPVVVDAARRFFGVRPDAHLRLHVGDGRAFVERAAEGTWDLIVLDAYGPSSAPVHLATREFLEAMRGRLAPGGVCAANVWVVAYNRLYPRMRATWAAAFPELHVVATPAGSDIFLGLRDAVGLDRVALVRRAGEVERDRRLGVGLDRVLGRLRTDEVPAGVPPLTDER